MKKLSILFSFILLVGCAGEAMVDIGVNDQSLLAGLYGDLQFTVTEIEVYDGSSYLTIWQGTRVVQVAIQTSDFVSITDSYETITPGEYQNMRLTVEGLRYILNETPTTIIDTVMQINATGFLEYSILDGEEYRAIISIVSSDWFDLDSLEIRDGYQPFQGSRLRFEQQY